MAETVTMPKLGFDMAEGTLQRWVVAVGEQVSKGKVLAEIETDKATVEVESNFEGVLRKQLVGEGDVVPVGTPIAIIGGADEKIEDGETASGESASGGAPAGVGDSAPGAFTAKEMAQAESGATTLKPPVGVVGEVKAKTPEGAADQALSEKTGPGEQGAGADSAEAEVGLPGGLRASPLARRMAEENSVDLKQVKGSGPNGRITRKDVEAFMSAPVTPPSGDGDSAARVTPPSGDSAAKPAGDSRTPTGVGAAKPAGDSGAGGGERIPLNRLRAAIGRRMVEAKQQAPHFYVTHEYDVAALLDLRKQVNAMLGDEGKVSVNDFIVKATALALRRFPNLNASLDGDAIVRHANVHVGVAVAVEGGLLTIVCRDADRKALSQISQEVRSMAGRAREGKVRPDDIQGSTFSISNLGMFDVENFIAILNPPEAAILAVGSAREVPVVVDGEVKVGTRMKATISVDHRVSDGAEAAKFMQVLAEYLENPMRILI